VDPDAEALDQLSAEPRGRTAHGDGNHLDDERTDYVPSAMAASFGSSQGAMIRWTPAGV
jgi:hypothetical protein